MMASKEPRSEDEPTIVCGYLNKIDSLGLIKTAKKRWYVLGSRSHHLYAYKNPRETLPVNEIDIANAVFNCDASNAKAFQIRTAKGQVHHFETLEAKERVKWLDALQRCRGSYASSQIQCQHFTESKEQYPHLREFFQHLSNDDQSPITEIPTSVFYLTEAGDVHESSLNVPNQSTDEKSRMEKDPSPVVERRNRLSTAGIDNAVSRMSAILSKLSIPKKHCETCTDLVNVIDTLKERCVNLNDELLANRELVRVLQNSIVTCKNQMALLQRYDESKSTAITGQDQGDHSTSDEVTVKFLLDAESARTALELENAELKREILELKDRIGVLEENADQYRSELELMKTALKTKDEMITVLAESNSGVYDVEAAIEDIPECYGTEPSIFPETVVSDVTSTAVNLEQEIGKLKDLVQGYQTQNQFLNKEILELHQVIKSLEQKEHQSAQRLFEAHGQYYQLKSRYLLLLNHFQPEKELAPRVVAELLEDAKANALAPRGSSRYSFTDELGFYLSPADDVDKIRQMRLTDDGVTVEPNADHLLMTASECKKFSDELESKHRRETSDEYLTWLTRWDSILVNFADKPIAGPCSELKDLIRSGIPHTYRAKVWKSLSQWWVKEEMSEVGAGYFECLCKKTRSIGFNEAHENFDPALKQIDLDLTRTLPHNKYFDDIQAEKIEPLRRVLYAFRWHNREVGYCQGLNRLAAVALLYLSDEDAFWCLVAIVDHLQPKDYYGNTMLVAQSDQRVLKDLVQDKLPKLAAHLRQANVDLSLFTFNWFLTVFVDTFPHKTFLNIWDCFLSEGNKVIFRFALAALKLAEAEILSCRTSGALHSCLNKIGERMTNYGKLAQVAFRDLNPFPAKHIEAKRQYHFQQLQALLENVEIFMILAMTGAAFKDFLRELKYDGIDQLRADQLNFMCSDRYMRRFIEHIIANCNKEKNLVTDEELKKFEQLKSEGRLITNPEERRRLLLEAGTLKNNDNDALECALAKEKFEAAEKYLQQLLELENQLTKVDEEQTVIETAQMEKKRKLMAKLKSELKETQAELLGLDIEIRTVSERFMAFLTKIKPSSFTPVTLSSVFLSAVVADQCVSSVEDAISQCYESHQSVHNDISSTSCLDVSTSNDEISNLVNSFESAFLDEFVNEIRAVDVQSQMDKLRELQRHLAGVQNQRDFMRIIEEPTDSATIIQSMKDKIKTFINEEATDFAKMESEFCVAKALEDDYSQKIDFVDSYLAKEEEILANLKHELSRLNILKSLLLEEQRELEESGCLPEEAMQKILKGRTKRAEECKEQLEASISSQADVRKMERVKHEPSDEKKDADDSCANMIDDLSKKQAQALAIHKDVMKEFTELNEAISKHGQQLDTFEKKLSCMMKEYEMMAKK